MKSFKEFLEEKNYNEMDADLPKDIPQHIANPAPKVQTAQNNFGSMGSYLPTNWRYANEKTSKAGPNLNMEMNKYKNDIISFLQEAGAKDNQAIKNIAEDIVQDLIEQDPSGRSLDKIPSLKGHQEVKSKGLLQFDSNFASLDRSVEAIKNLYLNKSKLQNLSERKAIWSQIEGDIMIKSLQDAGK